MIERLSYRTHAGRAEGDLYRPPSGGPHPGVVVCLGVVPAGVEHPQVARLGQALARSGFAALLHWSPAMRDLRLDPADVADLASAYETLLAQPYVDPARSGLLGTCVGGSFALHGGRQPPHPGPAGLRQRLRAVRLDVDARARTSPAPPARWATRASPGRSIR